MSKFNIIYDGEVLHKAVSYEKSTEILDELAEKFYNDCLLYTSPSPRDKRQSRMPSSA